VKELTQSELNLFIRAIIRKLNADRIILTRNDVDAVEYTVLIAQQNLQTGAICLEISDRD